MMKNKIEDFGVGDVVRFNNNCGTTYIRGRSATVVGRGRSNIMLKLHRPVGEFVRRDSSGLLKSVRISASPEIVDLIDDNL